MSDPIVDKEEEEGPKETSIDVALNLLELFSSEKRELGITEMARLLGKKASTIHRTVTVLKNRGYIEQSSQRGKYRLGLRVFELGCVYQNQSDVMRDASTTLERIAKATDETVNLAVLDQSKREVSYIAKIDSSHVLKTDIQIGTKLYAHCTALGKVLLASLDDATLDRLFPANAKLQGYTAKSLTSVADLKREIALVRERGYAIDDEEFRSDVVCIAMPYKDLVGKVSGAISVTGPALRMTEGRIREVCQAMKDAIGP